MLFLLSSACNDGENIANKSPYVFNQPANFPPALYTFENNPVTANGFELGRFLFYDPVLSADSTIACANCHQQVKGFSDPVHKFSKGVSDASGFRNAPAIQNMAFQDHFFWDGGSNHLDFVPINAINSEIEMKESLAGVVAKLQRSERYKEKFKKAFGSTEINSQKMLHALSQFMNMMVSDQSRYDRYSRGDTDQLTAEEVEGMRLFQTRCANCHATDLFTDGSFRNNGLDTDFFFFLCRARITEREADAGKFKVPSLRNAELTAPYMHDGRFKTLESVLDHYAGGVNPSPTLDPVLMQGDARGIALTEEEKEKIIAFIKTLTDDQFVKDKRFSAPVID